MTIFLLLYWLVTTIYGAYWLVLNPPIRRGDDSEYYTLLDVIAKIFPAAILAWIFIPMMLLDKIKFKRK